MPPNEIVGAIVFRDTCQYRPGIVFADLNGEPQQLGSVRNRLGRKDFGQPPPYYAAATVTTGEKDPLTGKAPEFSLDLADLGPELLTRRG